MNVEDLIELSGLIYDELPDVVVTIGRLADKYSVTVLALEKGDEYGECVAWAVGISIDLAASDVRDKLISQLHAKHQRAQAAVEVLKSHLGKFDPWPIQSSEPDGA